MYLHYTSNKSFEVEIKSQIVSKQQTNTGLKQSSFKPKEATFNNLPVKKKGIFTFYFYVFFCGIIVRLLTHKLLKNHTYIKTLVIFL